MEEVLGALLASATLGRELARDCKALDPWGTAARRSDHIVKLKTSAKEKQKEHTHTLKSQKQIKMTRTLEEQDRDERQNQHAQIYTPTNYPHTSAHA